MRFNDPVSVDWGFIVLGALMITVGCVQYRSAEPESRRMRKLYKSMHAPQWMVEAQTPALMRLIGIGALVMGATAIIVGVSQ
jgi:hypothetical protein